MFLAQHTDCRRLCIWTNPRSAYMTICTCSWMYLRDGRALYPIKVTTVQTHNCFRRVYEPGKKRYKALTGTGYALHEFYRVEICIVCVQGLLATRHLGLTLRQRSYAWRSSPSFRSDGKFLVTFKLFPTLNNLLKPITVFFAILSLFLIHWLSTNMCVDPLTHWPRLLAQRMFQMSAQSAKLHDVLHFRCLLCFSWRLLSMQANIEPVIYRQEQ